MRWRRGRERRPGDGQPAWSRRLGALAVATALLLSTVQHAAAQGILADGLRLSGFDDLPGWDSAELDSALDTWRKSCDWRRDSDWPVLCAIARGADVDARAFFETFFVPAQLEAQQQMRFTAYFEPELRASDTPDEQFTVPILRHPGNDAALPRRDAIAAGALDGKGLEIAWLENPADLYFLQLQGSGRLILPDGRLVRLGYGGQNGHPRRPVSAEFVRQGILQPHQASASAIRSWVARNPDDGAKVLATDPSYVFFDVLSDHPPTAGPLGAMRRPLTAGLSLAVDPEHVPLGAPVWVRTQGAVPVTRLMVAQDTGGAIRGPRRADIFVGTGPVAGARAARISDAGTLVILLPIELAHARAAWGQP